MDISAFNWFSEKRAATSSATMTPAGPSYAPPFGTESKWEPIKTLGASLICLQACQKYYPIHLLEQLDHISSFFL